MIWPIDRRATHVAATGARDAAVAGIPLPALWVETQALQGPTNGGEDAPK